MKHPHQPEQIIFCSRGGIYKTFKVGPKATNKTPKDKYSVSRILGLLERWHPGEASEFRLGCLRARG